MEINETKEITSECCTTLQHSQSSFRKNYNGVLMHTMSEFKKGSGINVIGSSE